MLFAETRRRGRAEGKTYTTGALLVVCVAGPTHLKWTKALAGFDAL